MPRSGNIFMTVDTHCQITFISTWTIQQLHKVSMFRTELIITLSHLHLSPLPSSSLSVIGKGRCSSPSITDSRPFPYHLSLTFALKEIGRQTDSMAKIKNVKEGDDFIALLKDVA